MAGSSRSDDLFDVDGVIDLYGLEPSEFVAARSALVKELKASGEKATAARVAKLRKPSVVAAALNRVARQRADDVDGLITASEALADVQRATLLGGDPAELRTAATDRRRLLREVAAEATVHVGAAKAAEVSATLEAALAGETLVVDLRRGTLVDTLAAPAGFGFGVADEDGPEAPAPARPRAKGASGTKAARGAVAAEATVGNPDWAAEERARRKAERAERRKAEARLETAAKALDQGEAELRAAEAELAAAQDAVARARDRVGEAAARCDALSAAVKAAESELAALADG